MDYDNTNRGAIFENKKKNKESQPDRTGSLNVDGRDYWISGWLKKSKDGANFLSLSVELKGEPSHKSTPKEPDDSFKDDIPF